MQKILLRDVLPDFAHELEHLLLREHKPELSCQVGHMRIDVAKCVSGDEFCTILCSGLRPPKGWGAGQTTIVLRPERGNILLDVINGDIVAVEVFFRKDIQEKLLHLRPLAMQSLDCPEDKELEHRP